MRKSVRFLTALIGILLILPIAILSVGAKSIAEQNHELVTQKKDTIAAQLAIYREKDTTEGKTWWASTGNAVNEYTTKLDGYSWNAENLRTNEINLAAAQGQAVGRMSWIYYSHGEHDEATKAVYDAQKAVIDGKGFGDIALFFEGENPGVHDCYTALLAQIYKVKYEAMREAEDSPTVKGIIGDAIKDLTYSNRPQYLTYVDEDASNYKNHFDATATRVAQQRNRDKASDQVTAIFSILYPDANGDFSNNQHLKNFYDSLSLKKEVEEINALLLGTVKGLLEDQKDGRDRLSGYIDEMKSLAEATVSSANTSKKVAPLKPLFDTYSVESGRAKLRDDWHDAYVDALDRIADLVGEDTTLEHAAQGTYLRVDGELLEADASAWDAVYTDGQAALADVVADAEAKNYTEKHGAILNRALNDVTVSDIPSLEAAMTDASALSDLASAKLADKLEKLGESYKVAIQKKIMETAKDDVCQDLRNQWIAQVNQKVGALSVADLDALKEQTDSYLAKANTIAEMLDRYAEICSAEGYGNYKENFKAAMRKTATDAASDALEAIPMNGMTLEQRLQELKDDTALDLAKQEGIARIYAAAKDSTLSDVAQILTETQNRINAEENRDAIPVLVSSAVKDIEACLAKEEMRKRTAALKAEIDAMPYLSQSEKDSYRAQADAIYESGVKGLSTGTAANALSSYNAAYAVCKNTAKQRNQALGLEQAKQAAKDRLDQAYAQLQSNRDLYSKESLEELERIYGQAYDSIGKYTDQNDLDGLDAIIDEQVQIMQQIPYNRLYTEDKLLSDSSYDLMHPTGYNPKVDGYIGSVEASVGLPSHATLTIQAVDCPDVIKLIREAAKAGRVSSMGGNGVSEELLSRLITCRLGAALDISMGDALMSENNVYTVSVLLSDDVKISDIIGVVYLCEDGSLEYYEITSQSSLIRFTTTHFSNYYVVTDKVINLIPVIVALAVLFVCEIVVLIYLYRRKNRTADTGTQKLAAVSMPLFLLTKYTPKGAFWIIGALSVGVLALGGWIAYVIFADRTEKETEQETADPLEEWEETDDSPMPEEWEDVDESPMLEEGSQEVFASLPTAEAKGALPEAEKAPGLDAPEELAALGAAEELAALGAAEELAALGAAEDRAALRAAEKRAVLTGREEFPVLEAATDESVIYEGSFTEATGDWIQDMVNEMEHTEDTHVSVCAEEVDSLMTDEEARESQETDILPTVRSRGTKKAQVNLDTISATFSEGDTVTLDSLKEKKLVGRKVGAVKILARGTLNKSLIVIAQDFSMAAVKMILLTGGQVIVQKSSGEQTKKTL